MRFLLQQPPKYKVEESVSITIDKDGTATLYNEDEFIMELKSARVLSISADVIELEGFYMQPNGNYAHKLLFLRSEA